MAEQVNGGQRWDVHCSGAVAEQFHELQRRASPALRKRIAAAFKEIIRRLQENPKKLGEALYQLPNLRMQVRTGVVAPLGVVFGVCEDRPLVFIRSGKLLSAP
jgi:hypothetical protein